MEEPLQNLIVDGGVVNITGTNTHPFDAIVRQLAFPGDGVSFSPTNPKIDGFADRQEWIDAWWDGPGQTSVRLKGDSRTMGAAPVWVACDGPNFAPEPTPLASLYDVLHNLKRQQGWKKADSKVSFRRNIHSILQRLDPMRWVSEATLLEKGWAELEPLPKENHLKNSPIMAPPPHKCLGKSQQKSERPPP